MGAPLVRRWISIGTEPLDAADVAVWLGDSGAGAHNIFLGVVRDNDGTRDGVLGLDYDAYEPHATNALNAIATSLEDDFPTTRSVALLHRLGHLRVGEVAVIVAIGAAHRDEVFHATSEGISRIKRDAPIFKAREYFEERSGESR